MCAADVIAPLTHSLTSDEPDSRAPDALDHPARAGDTIVGEDPPFCTVFAPAGMPGRLTAVRNTCLRRKVAAGTDGL